MTMFAGAGLNNFIPKEPATFGLTLTERVELTNWAIFDTLPTLLSATDLGARYLNSPELEATDDQEMFKRMKRVLEGIPLGDPVKIPEATRMQIHHFMLDACWFSEPLSNQFACMPPGLSYCYLRARYVFLSHWLAGYPTKGLEVMGEEIAHIADLGLSKRYALQEVPFTGRVKS